MHINFGLGRYLNKILEITQCKVAIIAPKRFNPTKVSRTFPDTFNAIEDERTVKEKLFQRISNDECGNKKITIVGTGKVGIATATALLTQQVTNDLLLIDKKKDLAWAEAEDLMHGAQFLNNATIRAAENFAEASDSSIVIVTAGTRGKPGEDPLILLHRNIKIIEEIIPKLIDENNKNIILIIVTSPCDILTKIAWRKTRLDGNRVMGTGTSLDSSRFQYYLAKRLGFQISLVNGMVVGEHGGTVVPIWSQVKVGGVCLRELYPKFGLPNDPRKFGKINKDIIDAANAIIGMKGYTSTACAAITATLCRAILLNTQEIMPVTVNARGWHGIKSNTFLSLPCQIGINGVTSIVEQTVDPLEIEQIKKCADDINQTLVLFEMFREKFG